MKVRETYIPMNKLLTLKLPFWSDFWREEGERYAEVRVWFDDKLDGYRVTRIASHSQEGEQG